jgi:hypothetical protein
MGETMQPSLLEQLRQRLQQEIAPPQMSANERLAAMGRGILSNRGSLLDNLSAGLSAQNQAEAARREEARKAAELEAEIARRSEETRLKEEELRNPDVSALRQAQAFYYRQRPEMGAGATDLRRQGLIMRARQAALTELSRDPLWPTRSQAEQARLIDTRAAQILPSLEAEGAPTSASTQPEIPTIDPRGRPAR